MNHEAGLAIIRSTVADSLGLAEAQVQDGKRLITELGANSLDIIDMMFALEKKFGVKMRDGELEAMFKLDFSSPDVVQDGFIVPAVVERLTAIMPALRAAPDPARVQPRELIGMITVETLWLVVERRLTAG